VGSGTARRQPPVQTCSVPCKGAVRFKYAWLLCFGKTEHKSL
jgi:hypothetical protein